MKTLFTIIGLCLAMICTAKDHTNTKAYRIKSLEGSNEVVVVREDLGTEILQLIYAGDTVCLSDAHGGYEMKTLDDHFLEILYGVRGGSGVHCRRTMLLCISSKKLNFPAPAFFNVTSYSNNSMVDKYEVKEKVIPQPGAGFKLQLHVHSFLKDEFTPRAEWYDYKKTYSLKFDKKRNIFYTGYKVMDKKVIFYNGLYDKTGTIHLKGEVPVINIDSHVYYYTGGMWYEEDTRGGFVKVVSSCKSAK